MQISSRWNLLKGQFSLSVEKGERVSASRTGKRERGIWQRRFWAHLTPIKEISTGMSNIDWNPVKHGKAGQVADWPYSSFHHYAKLGVYPSTWGYAGEFDFDAGE
jgi:putative transposase